MNVWLAAGSWTPPPTRRRSVRDATFVAAVMAVNAADRPGAAHAWLVAATTRAPPPITAPARNRSLREDCAVTLEADHRDRPLSSDLSSWHNFGSRLVRLRGSCRLPRVRRARLPRSRVDLVAGQRQAPVVQVADVALGPVL